jgi:glycosyltransferase involved in cell wall biosynthesis
MKFALVSHVFPPTWSGQSVVLSRLLDGLSSNQYCLISRVDYGIETTDGVHMPRLTGKYFYLPAELNIIRGQRFRLTNFARGFLNTMVGVMARGRRIARIVQSEKCDAIISCSGDLLDLPAAYFASRLARVPFYPYFFDYYAYQFIEPMTHRHAAFMEPYLVRGAKDVIVPNETLAAELKQRYGIEPAVIHNPCDLSQYSSALTERPARSEGEIKITYTGAIYDAHFDAFRNLLTAIKALGRGDVRLHVYTALPRVYLEANGIHGPVVFHDHVATNKVSAIQNQSDILFLPLAFDSPYPEIIRTSAPGKLGEYLAAGRPVLVHAPADSFASWYFRLHECGTVVDRNDAAEVRQALQQLLSDAELRRRLSHNARKQAESDFSVEKARAVFYDLMGLDSVGLN